MLKNKKKNRKDILQILNKYPEVSLKHIQKETGLARNTIWGHLRDLEKEGKISYMYREGKKHVTLKDRWGGIIPGVYTVRKEILEGFDKFLKSGGGTYKPAGIPLPRVRAFSYPVTDPEFLGEIGKKLEKEVKRKTIFIFIIEDEK